jgi:hypothetical protein
VFHKPGDTITDNSSPNQVKLPFGTDLTNIGTGLTIEDIKGINPYIGIDKVETTISNTYSLPRNNNNLFEYYNLMDSDNKTKAFGVFISDWQSTGNNTSIINVCKGEGKNSITIGNNSLGFASTIIGKIYLSNPTGSTEVSCLSNGIQFTKKDSPNDKKTIPYGTDLTNYNKTTFRQSIIDHISINNSNGDLYNKITCNQKYSIKIKTLVNDDIFPKTTNTLLTAYYTSYIKTNIPQTTNTTIKLLFQYFCTNNTIPIIQISLINSTETDPQLVISIFDSNSSLYNKYIIKQDVPKLVIDLTADLLIAGPGEEIAFAQSAGYIDWRTQNEFYQDCINIFNNIFISYTYEE